MSNIRILKNENINDFVHWSIWKCKVSKFDWHYEQEEHCFIIEGEASINIKNSIYIISQGDYVIFDKGLKCKWNILKDISKYYIFK